MTFREPCPFCGQYHDCFCNPLGESSRDLCRWPMPKTPRNAWLEPVAEFIFPRWVQCSLIVCGLIILLIVLAFTTGAKAATAPCDEIAGTSDRMVLHDCVVTLNQRIAVLEETVGIFRHLPLTHCVSGMPTCDSVKLQDTEDRLIGRDKIQTEVQKPCPKDHDFQRCEMERRHGH